MLIKASLIILLNKNKIPKNNIVMQHPDKEKTWSFLVPIFAIFTLYGVFTSIFGPLAPSIMSYYGIDTGKNGLIISLQNTGGLFCALLCLFFADRFNKFKLIYAGIAVFVLGIVAICAAPPYILLLAVFFICGFGATLIDINANALMPERFPERKMLFLPLIHIFYGIGAISGPFFTIFPKISKNSASWNRAYYLPAVAGLIIFIFYIISLKVYKNQSLLFPYKNTPDIKVSAGSPAAVFIDRKIWIIFLSAFTYCCFLVGFTTWMPYHVLLHSDVPAGYSGISLTVFFTGSLCMRFMMPLVLKKFSPLKIFLFLPVPAALIAIAAVLTGNTTTMLTLYAISGFLQGMSFSSLILIACTLYPARTSSASSVIILAYCCAGFVAPWAIGEAIKKIGSTYPLIGVCALLAISPLIILSIRKTLRQN
jgi:fucose permease